MGSASESPALARARRFARLVGLRLDFSITDFDVFRYLRFLRHLGPLMVGVVATLLGLQAYAVHMAAVRPLLERPDIASTAHGVALEVVYLFLVRALGRRATAPRALPQGETARRWAGGARWRRAGEPAEGGGGDRGGARPVRCAPREARAAARRRRGVLAASRRWGAPTGSDLLRGRMGTRRIARARYARIHTREIASHVTLPSEGVGSLGRGVRGGLPEEVGGPGGRHARWCRDPRDLGRRGIAAAARISYQIWRSDPIWIWGRRPSNPRLARLDVRRLAPAAAGG